MTQIKAGSRFGTGELAGQAGQASVLLLLILGTFLLASVGFAVDLSNMWFHRQAAQSAADAACVAGAMDMLYLHNGTITTSPGFTVGTSGDCASSPSAALCQYAKFNGYTATTSAAGWSTSTVAGAVAVSWTFPTVVTGVTAASGITYPVPQCCSAGEAGYLVHGSGRGEVAHGWSVLYLRTAARHWGRAACHSESYSGWRPYRVRGRAHCDRRRSPNQHSGELLCQWFTFSQRFEQRRLLQRRERLSH